MLEKTTENILLLTRAFRVFDKPENKVGETIPCFLEVHFNTIASHIIFQEQSDSNCFLMSNTETLQTRFFQFELIDNPREIQPGQSGFEKKYYQTNKKKKKNRAAVFQNQS